MLHTDIQVTGLRRCIVSLYWCNYGGCTIASSRLGNNCMRVVDDIIYEYSPDSCDQNDTNHD